MRYNVYGIYGNHDIEQGNKMIVTIGDHTLEPKEYDLFGDYIILPDMDSLLVYGNTVKFGYKVMSSTNEVNRVEVNIDSKIYNVEIPINTKTNKMDDMYLIGVVESIINPC